MRVLIFFSYIGTGFRGAQIQNKASVQISNCITVQGVLENCFQNILGLKGNRPIKFYLSSRTDTGVHAIRNAGHLNLDGIQTLPFYKLLYLTNKYLKEKGYQIRINEVFEVPESFHARHSIISRTYLYRFGVKLGSSKSKYDYPVSELNRTYLFQTEHFDIEKAEEAVKLFQGLRDYGAFIGSGYLKKNPHTITKRDITNIQINSAFPLMRSHDFYSELYKYFEITCTCRSFLIHMVRKITSVAIAAGCGKICLHDIQSLFDKPKPESWNPKIQSVPGYGLYLLDTLYRKEDFNLTNSQNQIYSVA